MAGKRREDIPDAGATMQLDALADGLEDLGAPSGYGLGPSRPPPLPPKKASAAMWVVGALVVVLMMALGVGAGFFLFGGGEPVAAPTPSAPSAPAPNDPAPAEAADDVVQMDEVVFEAPAEP